MLIAGPNLTIDRTLRIGELRPGEVLRFEDVAVTPGGKGVNVARVAQALGAPAVLVGFTPGHTGEACARMLADEGLALRAVRATGELRSTAVVLEHGGRVTVFNEPGPPSPPRRGRATSQRSRRLWTATASWPAAAAPRPVPRLAPTPSWPRSRAPGARSGSSTPTARCSRRRWRPGPIS